MTQLMKYNHLNQQKTAGLSLVELLMAVLLSSFLVLMTVNLYFGTKKTEQLATTSLETQTQASNALHLLRQAVEHAGFSSEVSNAQAKKSTFTANDLFAAGQVLRITGSNDNQRLLVRLQGDEALPLRACNGDTIALGSITAQTVYEFYVDESALKCQLYENNLATGDPVIIANNVAAFKLRATTQTSNNLVTQIQEETPIAANQAIKGLHIQLILRSQRSIRTEPKRTLIQVTGFDDLEFNDEFYYVDSSHYFLAQNQ